MLQQTQAVPSSHLPKICSPHAKILINSSTTPPGGRRLSCQPHLSPTVSSEPWESSTLTGSCGGIGRQTILLVLRAFGGAETMDVGSCIFAREAGQGESCKRSTKTSISRLWEYPWEHKTGWMEDLSSPAATGKKFLRGLNLAPRTLQEPVQALITAAAVICSLRNIQGSSLWILSQPSL